MKLLVLQFQLQLKTAKGVAEILFETDFMFSFCFSSLSCNFIFVEQLRFFYGLHFGFIYSHLKLPDTCSFLSFSCFLVLNFITIAILIRIFFIFSNVMVEMSSASKNFTIIFIDIDLIYLHYLKLKIQNFCQTLFLDFLLIYNLKDRFISFNLFYSLLQFDRVIFENRFDDIIIIFLII